MYSLKLLCVLGFGAIFLWLGGLMIWVVGSGGMLGRELCARLEGQGLSYLATDRELDILDPTALSAYARGKDIRTVINCAAYTAVDKAEDEPEPARRLNVEGPSNLAILCRAMGARLIQLSTDYVFSGTAAQPYDEGQATGPKSVYGRTKADGEAAVLRENPDSIIMRTAWLYGAHGPNFVFTMLRLMKEQNSINVVNDQRGSPTWTADLSLALSELATRADVQPGIYHYTNEGQTTWYEFALEIKRLGLELGILEKDCAVNPISTAQYPTKAARPAYSVLLKDKIKALGIPVPTWQDSLKKFMESSLTQSHKDTKEK